MTTQNSPFLPYLVSSLSALPNTSVLQETATLPVILLHATFGGVQCFAPLQGDALAPAQIAEHFTQYVEFVRNDNNAFAVLGILYENSSPPKETLHAVLHDNREGIVTLRALLRQLRNSSIPLFQVVTLVIDVPGRKVYPNPFPPIPATLFPGPGKLRALLHSWSSSL